MNATHRVLVLSAVAAAIGFFSGMRSSTAFPKWCLVYTGTSAPSQCGSCVNAPCPACDAGTCPGEEKECKDQFNYVAAQQPGFTFATVVTVPCFVLYECKPIGESCSAGQCFADYLDFQESSTTFPRNILGGPLCQSM